jgi:hypothetical protein
MRYHVLIITGIVLLSGFSAHADNSRIHYNDQDLFLNGLNLAWRNFADDIGPNSSTPDMAHFESVFSQMEANGANVMRLWLHTTGYSTPQFNSSGVVIGPGTNTISDLEAILDLAWEHNISLMLCLWSFDMLQNNYNNTTWNKAILTESTKMQAYIDTCLVPMVTALQGHPAIVAWEIFNEPEGMTTQFGWSDVRVTMSDIQWSVNKMAGAIHRADPSVLVTNGCWDMQAGTDVDGHYNYYTNARLIAAGGDTDGILDFYCIHYYDWAGTEHSPFQHSASYWGLDKPLVIAEFFPNCTYCTSTSYESLYQNGYAGAMAWSWTDTVPQSQMLNHILAVSSAHPADVLIIQAGQPVPPTCAITWPQNNIRIRENTTMTVFADAADTDGTVTKVEFFRGTTKLGEDTASPYNYSWAGISEGTYSLTARATDSNNLTAVSPVVTLIVGGSTVGQDTRFEAEAAVYDGNVSVGTNAAASAGHYLNMTSSGSITWTVSVSAAGTYGMTIGYNLYYATPKTQYLRINGGSQTSLVFNDSQTNTWLKKTVQVSLNSGINTIKIENWWGWMYFDYIELPLPVLCSQGDLNMDCDVDFDDLLIMAAGWINPYVNEDMANVSRDWLK